MIESCNHYRSSFSVSVAHINYDEISKINYFLDVLGTEQNVHIHNINEIVRRIENLFISNSKASFGQKRIKPNSHRQNTTNKQWFNKECRDARNTYHNVRRLYNKYKTNHYKHLLKTSVMRTKKAISKNIKRHNNEKITKLKSMKRGQPRDFWKIINSVNSQPKQPPHCQVYLTISKMLMQIYQKIQVTTYTKKILIHVKAIVHNI